MPDRDQFGIYTKAELQLIKDTFADNDTLLYTIRKVFLQFPLTDTEKGLIKMSVTPAVYEVLKKRILPDLAPCYPLGQIPSVLVTLTQELKVKDVEEMSPQFEAKKIEMEYLKQQFLRLEDIDIFKPGEEPIKLSDMSVITNDTRTTYVWMTAYLFLLGYIDPSLNAIKIIAGQKEESPDEQEKRLKREDTK